MTGDTTEVIAARQALAEAQAKAAVELAAIRAELAARPTPDDLRAEAATVTWHIGPAGGCCPTAPCGLVVAERADPQCPRHGYVHTGQSHVDTHAADHCPGEAS